MDKQAKNLKQLSFFGAPAKSHGGPLRTGKRKSARPIATRRPMHVIVRSQRARGKWCFLRSGRAVETALSRTAKRFHVRIYRFQNVGNHLHLAVQVSRREDFQNFLRVFLQAVAFSVAGARKGNPIGRFWDGLACSRVVEWGRDWRNLMNYFEKNRFEALGMPRDVVDLWFAEEPGPA